MNKQKSDDYEDEILDFGTWFLWAWRLILGLVIIIELDSSLKIKINSRFQPDLSSST